VAAHFTQVPTPTKFELAIWSQCPLIACTSDLLGVADPCVSSCKTSATLTAQRHISGCRSSSPHEDSSSVGILLGKYAHLRVVRASAILGITEPYFRLIQDKCYSNSGQACWSSHMKVRVGALVLFTHPSCPFFPLLILMSRLMQDKCYSNCT
jgi:hypothetical protein